MTEKDTFIHLFAGGTAGTAGAVLTCPLEVVKTRFQSSAFLPMHALQASKIAEVPGLQNPANDALRRPEQRRKLCTTTLLRRTRPQRAPPKAFKQKNAFEKLCLKLNKLNVYAISSCGISSNSTRSMSIMQCLKYIIANEGPRALFKGIGPNVLGVAPSRAIYFCAYSQAKSGLNTSGIFRPDSPIVHIVSASCAGFVSASATNPIWFVKTRLQLDFDSKHKMTVRQCVKKIYQQNGLRGFYKGISASYFGISETVVHFVIYEALKSKLVERRHKQPTEGRTSRDFLEFMLAGATSKTIATCLAYPHEVARTRMREEGTKYNRFWQTLFLVWREEGKVGLYRGLATQLIRSIPNTAILLGVYEAVVYVLSMKFNASFYLNNHNDNGKSNKN